MAISKSPSGSGSSPHAPYFLLKSLLSSVDKYPKSFPYKPLLNKAVIANPPPNSLKALPLGAFFIAVQILFSFVFGTSGMPPFFGLKISSEKKSPPRIFDFPVGFPVAESILRLPNLSRPSKSLALCSKTCCTVVPSFLANSLAINLASIFFVLDSLNDQNLFHISPLNFNSSAQSPPY